MKCYAYNNAAKRRRDSRQALTEAYNNAHGINPDEEVKPVRPLLTIKRTAMNRVDKALSVRETKVYDSLDNCVLPNVHLYSVNVKSSKNITVRAR
ncbi:hypothetical protein [Photorhabdus laumondii]|uniref:Photorhabdus luminescens subsp. laumondii TTO1 complete genome segment 10/17 n=1 Tax=Photorhabdus laumondii subsp. laumondii (strain DSM 15139 / CIP 105565 / TT01) TaxID=243265 RepID=Q7N2Z6_PHOLL|nr:hypothetical protein [Photorhabdus laumondii]AWK42634.1 hypothetical protein A4R40_14605 [Photorhabdus laumondii subsp. laumondii]AXG47959.1 hypothetical protein PluTT01m_15025 [Photorhabdus laumondii subsp. laumondii]CAE15301.1 unnamed protein product [Photorhabdus laumondii subsp. laumondii TTO1]